MTTSADRAAANIRAYVEAIRVSPQDARTQAELAAEIWPDKPSGAALRKLVRVMAGQQIRLPDLDALAAVLGCEPWMLLK